MNPKDARDGAGDHAPHAGRSTPHAIGEGQAALVDAGTEEVHERVDLRRWCTLPAPARCCWRLCYRPTEI
jgi:hypothetical protein